MMRSKRQRNRFEPTLETLENRCTPAITATQAGDTLNIQGDATADIASVTALANNTFRVISTAGTQDFSGVRNIQANLGEGDNVFSLNLRQSANVTANITTGSGADFVRVRLGGNFRSNDTLNLTVDTGAGSDSFGIVGTDPYQVQGASTNVYYNFKSRNTINATVNLGDGDDAALSYLSQLGRNDDVTYKVDGGSGSNFYSFANSVLGQDSNLNYTVTGGSGNDFQTTYLGALLRNSETNIESNLGDGDNTVNLAVTWLDRDAQLSETVNTGSGADIMRTWIGDTTDPAAEGRTYIWADAEVNINANLGAGNDIALVQFVGRNDKNANVTTNIDGGDGSDLGAFFFGSNRGNTRGRIRNVEDVRGGTPGHK